MSKTIPVIDIYGPVIQGEGAMAGQQTIFVRLGGCDYRCSWCDTMYAVDPDLVKENKTDLSLSQIAQNIASISGKTGCKTITWSGGNPVIHDLIGLPRQLREKGFYQCTETQGTLWRDWLYDMNLITVSPKPPSSLMKPNFKSLEKFLDQAVQYTNVCMKIVVFNDVDYKWAKHVMLEYKKRLGIQSFYLQTGTRMSLELLPDQEPHYEDLIRQVLSDTQLLMERVTSDPEMNFVRVMPQLHTLVFGQQRLN